MEPASTPRSFSSATGQTDSTPPACFTARQMCRSTRVVCDKRSWWRAALANWTFRRLARQSIAARARDRQCHRSSDRVTPVIEPGLVEMHFGEAEGLQLHDMADRFPELSERFQDLADQEVGFPGGETRREFHTRVRDTPIGSCWPSRARDYC